MGKDLIARIILRLQDEASKGLDYVRNRVNGVGQEIGQVNEASKELDSARDRVHGVGQAIDHVNEAGKGLDNTRDRVHGVSQAIDQVDEASKGLDNARDRVHGVGQAVDQFNEASKGLDSARDRVHGVGQTIDQVNEASKGLDNARNRISGIGQEIDRVKRLMIGFLSFAAITESLANIVNLSDTYARLTGRVKQAVGAGVDYIAKQKELFDISQRTNVALADTTALYARSAQALKNLSNGQALAAKLTETVNLSFKAQASSAAEVSSTVTQLTQSIATDAVQWEDFGQLADTNLMLVNVAAKNLGYDGIGALKQAMADGKVSNIAMVNAIVAGFDEIKAAADQMPKTVESSLVGLKNQFLQYIGQSKDASAATRSMADSIDFVSKHLEQFIDLGLKAGEVALALFAGSKLKALVVYTQEMIAARAAAEALAAEQAAAGNAAGTAATKVTVFAKALNLINGAVGALVAWEIGQTVGKWALHFEWVQYVGTNVAEMTSKFVAFGEFMTRPLSMKSWQDFQTELNNIEVHFDGVRARIGQADSIYADSAQKAASSEQAKAQAVEVAAQKQKEAFKVVQDAVKDLTANLDAETKRQTASIAQGLEDRLAIIDAMTVGEAQKDKLRVDAKLLAARQEVELQRQASEAKLTLIDQEYQAELAGAANNAARTKEIETQKRQDKLAVYSGLAEYYQGEVNRLSQVYASEYQAAAQAKQQLATLNANHQIELFNIKLKGMTAAEKLDAEQALFDDRMAQVKKERAKGDQADQDKINRLMSDARSLHEQIKTASGNSTEALSKDKERAIKLWQEEKLEIEANAQKHEENAARAKKALADVAAKLEETKKAITDITEALNQEYAVKIGIDSASLTAAQAAIADLVKPETKTITIVTQNAGGSAPLVAQATGGPAGQPTGELWRFNLGGHTPMRGLLPGFGGGDKVKALLERGEFVVRKEAVQKLGLPFMYLVNAGQVPVGDVIRRALGGPVDYDQMRRDSARSAAASAKQQKMDMIGKIILDIAQSTSAMSSQGADNAEGIASGAAARNDDIMWRQIEGRLNSTLRLNGLGRLQDKALRIVSNALRQYQSHGYSADLSGIKEQIRVMMEDEAIRDMQAQAAQDQRVSQASPVFSGLASGLSRAPLAGLAGQLQTAKPISLPPMGAIPSSSAPAATPPSHTIRVEFIAPNGNSVTGHFEPADGPALLQVIKDAGARTA